MYLCFSKFTYVFRNLLMFFEIKFTYVFRNLLMFFEIYLCFSKFTYVFRNLIYLCFSKFTYAFRNFTPLEDSGGDYFMTGLLGSADAKKSIPRDKRPGLGPKNVHLKDGVFRFFSRCALFSSPPVE